MLDFFRHHQKAIMLIAAVVVVTFMFWGATTKTGTQGGGGDDSLVTIYGRDYSRPEIQRLMRFQEVAYGLGLYEFAQTLEMIAQRYVFKDRSHLDFALNLLVLRKVMEDYGVQVSDSEAKEAFRRLPALQDKEGKFDAERASNFESNLGSYGFSVSDVYDLLRDSVGFDKLKELVGGNTILSNAFADKFYAESNQTIKASSIPFAADDFKKTAQVSDDEIKKYFEQNKDKYKTEPMRAVSYVFFPQPKDLEKLPADKKNEYGEMVNKFFTESGSDKTKFETLAKEMKVEVKTAPLFAEDNPPAALKDETTLIGEIFSNDPGSHPVSDAVQGKDGYYVFKVTQVQESKQQDLKDVQAKVKETLVSQKAQENMMKSVSDVRKKLEDALKAGKKFDDAAKEAGVHPQAVAEFTTSQPPKDLSNGRQIAEEASQTPAGSLTKPLTTEHGVIIVYVQSKVLYKSPENAALKQRLTGSLDRYAQSSLFHAWFDRRRDEAKTVPHFTNL